MLVDVIDLQRWRRQRASEVLDAIALAMLSAVRCELIDGKSAARLIGIDDRRAAALFLAAFARVRDEMAGPEVPDEPVHKAIDQLKRIAGMPV